MHTITWHAIGATKGVVLNKVVVIKNDYTIPKKTVVKNFDQEVKTLAHGYEQLAKFVQTLLHNHTDKVTQDIFKAHLEIIHDEVVREEVETLMKTEKVKADYAVHFIFQKYETQYATMDDPYFRERAHDIRDLKIKLVHFIQGIEPIDIGSIKHDFILVEQETTPSAIAQAKQHLVGIINEEGAKTSHSVIMAKNANIPFIVGAKNACQKLKTNEIVYLNAKTGLIVINPNQKIIQEFTQQKEKEQKLATILQKYKTAKTLAKGQTSPTFCVEANIGLPTEANIALQNGAEGVGLFRSEFLFMDNDHWPTEEEQYQEYKTALEAMQNRPVIIRTLDIGGDKQLSYFDLPKETNPFLGLRALRFCLQNKHQFKWQLKALLRAAKFGKLKIMLPMVQAVEEFTQVKKLLTQCQRELETAKLAFNPEVELGIMIEIPAAAVIADKLAEHADFFSIGTNDLIQYSLAADRVNEAVAYIYEPLHPAVLKLIKFAIDGAHGQRKECGMCGAGAEDPFLVPILMGLKLDVFSVSTSNVTYVRYLISQLDLNECEKLATEALKASTAKQVKTAVQKFLNRQNILY